MIVGPDGDAGQRHAASLPAATNPDSSNNGDAVAAALAKYKLIEDGEYMFNALFESHNSSPENMVPSGKTSAKKKIKSNSAQSSPFMNPYDYYSDGDEYDDSFDGKPRSKHAKTSARDSDHSGSSGDDVNRVKVRRERNRLAARKCRAKKMQFMLEMDRRMRELTERNEEMRVQMLAVQKMFSREIKLREAMKVVLQARWNHSNPFPGYSINDIIIGLESGTLDVNALLSAAATGSPQSILSSTFFGSPTTTTAHSYESSDAGSFFPSLMCEEGGLFGGPTHPAGQAGLWGGLGFALREAARPMLLPDAPLPSRPIAGQCVTTGASPVPVKMEQHHAVSPLPAAVCAGGGEGPGCGLQTVVIRGPPSASDGSATVTTQYKVKP